MKYKHVFSCILFLFGLNFINSQSKVFVNGGLSYYPDMKSSKKNNNFSISYFCNKKGKWFWEIQYFYSQNNLFPNFFYNSTELDKYILSRNANTIFDEVNWEFVKTNNLGVKIHHKLFEKNKFLLSANTGLFFKNSRSKKYFITKIYTLDSNLNDVVGYEYFNIVENQYGVGFRVGLHSEYEVYKNLIFAIDLGFNKNIEAKDTSYNDDYFLTALGLGYKF